MTTAQMNDVTSKVDILAFATCDLYHAGVSIEREIKMLMHEVVRVKRVEWRVAPSLIFVNLLLLVGHLNIVEGSVGKPVRDDFLVLHADVLRSDRDLYKGVFVTSERIIPVFIANWVSDVDLELDEKTQVSFLDCVARGNSPADKKW